MAERPAYQDRRPSLGGWVLEAAAIAALLISFFNYFSPTNGIHGSGGALLVVFSTALMLLAAGALMISPADARGRRGLLLTLIALDILGTALAAFMLEADWLVAAIGLALIGWILRIALPPRPRGLPANAVTS